MMPAHPAAQSRHEARRGPGVTCDRPEDRRGSRWPALAPYVRATVLVSVALALASSVLAVGPSGRSNPAQAGVVRAQSIDGTTVPVTQPAPIAPPTNAEGEIVDAAGVIAAVNAERSAMGLSVLQTDDVLSTGAQQWAQTLADAHVVRHDPDLTEAYADDWHRMSENVGLGDSLAAVHAAMLRDPQQHKNLLDPSAFLIAVGIVLGPDGTYLVERTVG